MENILIGEMLVFGFLGKILYTYPNEDLLISILDEDLFSEIPFGDSQENTKKGLALINNWIHNSEDAAEALRELKIDYTGLFIEITDKDLSPWESVYFSEERSIFHKRTLKIREWYRKFGLQISNLYKEPDDHIGLEFAFISHLAGLAIQAHKDGEREKYQEVVKAQDQFFSEHIFTWVPKWYEQIQEYAKTDFYRGIGFLVQGVLDEVKSVQNKNQLIWDAS
jgi:TorA maturation chaperone TorD